MRGFHRVSYRGIGVKLQRSILALWSAIRACGLAVFQASPVELLCKGLNAFAREIVPFVRRRDDLFNQRGKLASLNKIVIENDGDRTLAASPMWSFHSE